MRSPIGCLALALLASACLGELDEEPSTSQLEQGLFSVDGTKFWTLDRQDGMGTWWRANTVPVCFETGLDQYGKGYPYDSSSVPNFATYKAWFREAVEDSWGRVANLRFVHWGSCPSTNIHSLAGWVTVYWADGFSCVAGYRTDKSTRMSIARPDLYPLSKNGFQATVRHEMGHALGFAHEKDRPDKPPVWGTGEKCGFSQQSGAGWTEVYDPTSIMNYSYCDEAGLGELSPYDIYGVQRVYGRKPSKSIVGLNGRCVNTPGFNYANGTVLQVYDCYGQSNDTWSRAVVNGNQVIGQMSSPWTASVLSSRAPHHYWGTWTELQYYSGTNTNNIWRLKGVLWKAIGDMCVGPRSYSDPRLVLKICYADDPLQQWDWDYGVQGRFRNVGTGMCANVAYGSNATHTPINVYPCSTGTPYYNEVFTTTARGEIKYAGKCFNVANYFPEPGAELQLYDCAPEGTWNAYLQYNELFHLSGRVMHAWYSDALTIYGGNSVNGAQLWTYPYSASPNQLWDIYF